MTRMLHIACIQITAQPSFDTARDAALPLMQSAVAAGAKMLFLPEYCGGLATDGPAVAPPVADEDVHPFFTGDADVCRGESRLGEPWVNRRDRAGRAYHQSRYYAGPKRADHRAL